MDTSADVASWLSFLATLAGLSGLIVQISGISDHLDPFHSNRGSAYLGQWHQYQIPRKWYQLSKPIPQGPKLSANMSDGFCGRQILYLSRLPWFEPAGRAGWAVIMAIIHPQPVTRDDLAILSTNSDHHLEKQPSPPTTTKNDRKPSLFTSTGWSSLPRLPLTREGVHACIPLSRTTLITTMLLTNARTVFSYSDASGYRAGYASYNGQWYIDWPIGKPAVVHFAAHDSHAAARDVYPPCFPQRVWRCAQMVAGVVAGERSGLKVGICGRKVAGTYRAEYVVKGFPGAHGSRHLFNMLGGKVFEVDYIYARKVEEDGEMERVGEVVRLVLPSRGGDGKVVMLVPEREEAVLKHALDCLPWNHMSWSVHRGLKDMLVTYAKPVFNKFRPQLAAMLKQAVQERPQMLDAVGWDPKFVRSSMGEMASSAMLAGEGNSGDLVRVVTSVVRRCIVTDWSDDRLDEVTFWRKDSEVRELDLGGIVALTKLFILEWSNEFDYQMYHDLPLSLMFG